MVHEKGKRGNDIIIVNAKVSKVLKVKEIVNKTHTQKSKSAFENIKKLSRIFTSYVFFRGKVDFWSCDLNAI